MTYEQFRFLVEDKPANVTVELGIHFMTLKIHDKTVAEVSIICKDIMNTNFIGFAAEDDESRTYLFYYLSLLAQTPIQERGV